MSDFDFGTRQRDFGNWEGADEPSNNELDKQLFRILDKNSSTVTDALGQQVIKELNQFISNLIKEIIGEDEEDSHLMNETLGRVILENHLRAEQRQRAANLGFNIGDSKNE